MHAGSSPHAWVQRRVTGDPALYAEPRVEPAGCHWLHAFHPYIPASFPAAVETNKSVNAACAFRSLSATISERLPDGRESGFHKHWSGLLGRAQRWKHHRGHSNVKIIQYYKRDMQRLQLLFLLTSRCHHFSHSGLNSEVKPILKKISSVQLRFPPFIFMLLITSFVPALPTWHPTWMIFKSSSSCFRKYALIRIKAQNIVRFPDGILQIKRY